MLDEVTVSKLDEAISYLLYLHSTQDCQTFLMAKKLETGVNTNVTIFNSILARLDATEDAIIDCEANVDSCRKDVSSLDDLVDDANKFAMQLESKIEDVSDNIDLAERELKEIEKRISSLEYDVSRIET